MIDSLQTIGAARGQDAMSNEEVRAHCAKLAADKGKRPRVLAVSDFFKGINLLTVE